MIMKFKTADEANEESSSYFCQRVDERKAVIYSEIEKAIVKGEFSTLVECDYISKFIVEDILLPLGYSCNAMFNGRDYKISW